MKKTIFIVVTLIILVFLGVFVYIFAFFQTPSSGQHTGYITAVEKSGLILKTWVAYVKTDPQSSQEDTYCVYDPAVIQTLQTYEKSRTAITIYYASPWLLWKWQCAEPSAVIRSAIPVTQ